MKPLRLHNTFPPLKASAASCVCSGVKLFQNHDEVGWNSEHGVGSHIASATSFKNDQTTRVFVGSGCKVTLCQTYPCSNGYNATFVATSESGNAYNLPNNLAVGGAPFPENEVSAIVVAHRDVMSYTASSRRRGVSIIKQDCQPSSAWKGVQNVTSCAASCSAHDYFVRANDDNCKCCTSASGPGTLNDDPRMKIYGVNAGCPVPTSAPTVSRLDALSFASRPYADAIVWC